MENVSHSIPFESLNFAVNWRRGYYMRRPLGFHAAVPSSCERSANTKLIERPCHDMVDDVFDRLRAVIECRYLRQIRCGARRASIANCSSSDLRSLSRTSPSTWSNEMGRHRFRPLWQRALTGAPHWTHRTHLAAGGLPWTAGEPPEDCILVEGVHEVAVAVKACISPV